MIISILLILIIIFMIKHIYEIHNFNHDAILEQLQSGNKDEIFEKMKERKPLLIHNLGNQNNLFTDCNCSKIAS